MSKAEQTSQSENNSYSFNKGVKDIVKGVFDDPFGKKEKARIEAADKFWADHNIGGPGGVIPNVNQD